jgi:hypothetical protein
MPGQKHNGNARLPSEYFFRFRIVLGTFVRWADVHILPALWVRFLPKVGAN